MQAERQEAERQVGQLQEQIAQLSEDAKVTAGDAAAALEDATRKAQLEMSTLQAYFHPSSDTLHIAFPKHFWKAKCACYPAREAIATWDKDQR